MSWYWITKKVTKGLYCKCKEAKLQARIKPTALCSAIDKENSIEFPLDLVHYIYMQSNPNPVLLSCASLWVNLLSCVCQYYKFKRKEKEKKNNIQNKRKEKEKEKK